MKTNTLNPIKKGLFMAAFVLVCGMSSYAATFTAVASGNWSSAATWGGTAPSFTLGAGDQVNIGTGINVTMDGNVTLNGLLSQINVTGTLSADANIELDVISGTVAGTGTITVPELVLSATGAFSFSGSATVDTLVNSMIFSSSAQITVNDELVLSNTISIGSSASLQMGTNSNITVSGGGLTLGGGTVNLNAHYNVTYVSTSTTAGLELTGSGLGTVTINVSTGKTVTLSSNLVTTDSLKFTSGALALNGYNLTVNGEISGNIMIAGNTSSNVTINTAGGLASSLSFVSGSQAIDNLTVNVGSGNSVKLGSALTVTGALALSGNSNLNINGESLLVAGSLSGTGDIVANTQSRLSFTSSSSISGSVKVTGANVGRFIVNLTGSNSSINLGATLNVDTLDMIDGSLVLNGNNLTINGDIVAAGGGGMISSSASSNVTVATAASTSGALIFSSHDTVNNLNVNVGEGGSLKMGSNVVVKGTLAFTSGNVNLQNNNLTIASSGSISGAGSTSYVITAAHGYLTMNASVGSTTTYEIGTATNYLPAQLTLNAGSATGTVGVNVLSGVYSHDTTGVEISDYQPMVNATWLFQNNIGTGINANMKLSWEASAEVNGFVHTGDYISHYTADAWDYIIADTMSATLSGSFYSVTRANITSMSPFAVFDRSTNPTSINEVVNTDADITVYPNPTHQNLYIKSTLGVGYGEIYNVMGQMVSNFQIKDNLSVVPVGDLSPGMYIVKFYNDNTEVVKKITKL